MSPPRAGSVAIEGNGNAVGDGNSAASAKVTVNVQSPAPNQPPIINSLHQLPTPPSDFVGRADELKKLRDGIEHGGVAISGIAGLGGIGKTALALQLASELTKFYPDAALYLDLKGTEESPVSVGEALRYLIRAFHPSEQLPEDLAQLGALYRSMLHDKRAIILLDNAKDAEQVAPLMPPTCCAVIVTSRQYFTVPGLVPERLDTLTETDARALLLGIAPRIGNAADEIAQRLGYLPLALRLAASFMAGRANISPKDYLLRLQNVLARPEMGPVEASLTLSYDRLDNATQRRWRALSVFSGSFIDASAAAVWEVETEEAQDRLGELLSYSMVEWDEFTGRYRLHDLARYLAVARQSGDECNVANRRHAQHYQRVLALANEMCHRGGEDTKRGLIIFDKERSNIEAGQAWASAHASHDKDAAELCMIYPSYGYLVLPLRLSLRELISWFQSQLDAARIQNNREHESYALSNLGTAYLNSGEVSKTIIYYEEALAIDREISNRRSEGMALGSLGSLYFHIGEVSRSIEFHNQALAIAREVNERHNEAKELGNLGIIYFHIGEVHHAIELQEQSLAIACEIGFRSGESNALSNLGIIFRKMGDVPRAIELLEQDLTTRREFGDRWGEGKALGNLGNAYRDLGDVPRAIELFNQSLIIHREVGDRQGESITVGNLGTIYSNLGDVAHAIKLIEQQVVIAREIGDRDGLARGLFNMSLALLENGEREGAIARVEAGLVIFEEIGHPHAVAARALLEELQRDHAESE